MHRDHAQIMLLTAVLLVIGFVALGGIVLRVQQAGSATLAATHDDFMDAAREASKALDVILEQVAIDHPPGDVVATAAFLAELDGALGAMDTIALARGFPSDYAVTCAEIAVDAKISIEWTLMTHDARVVLAAERTFLLAECLPDVFEDVNCNQVFEATDVPLTAADVQDGIHDTGDTNCLVIGSGLGPITAPAIDFRSQGGGVVLFVDVTAATGQVLLDANGGTIVIEGQVVRSNADQCQIKSNGGTIAMHDATVTCFRQVQIDSNGGAVRAQGASITSNDDKIQILGNGAAIDIDDTTLTAQGVIQVGAGSGSTPAQRIVARLAVVSGPSDADFVANGDIDVSSAQITVSGSILLDATAASQTITVQSATFDDSNDKADVEPPGVQVSGAPAPGYGLE